MLRYKELIPSATKKFYSLVLSDKLKVFMQFNGYHYNQQYLELLRTRSRDMSM